MRVSHLLVTDLKTLYNDFDDCTGITDYIGYLFVGDLPSISVLLEPTKDVHCCIYFLGDICAAASGYWPVFYHCIPRRGTKVG